MIDEQSVERALHWMAENVGTLSKAISDRKYLEDFKKVKLSMLIQEAPPGTVSSKESWAFAHEDYEEVLQGLRAAVEQEAELKHMFTIAEARIEVWRTIQANNRAGVV
tara:strand:- start:82 stop:405 length:324 start_codon:yes stop_codon:yes gene_type:complete